MITEKIFGRTGYKSKRVIFGAVAFLEAIQDGADAIMAIRLKSGNRETGTVIASGEIL